MTKIVALSGKKQAGKNTPGNFLFGLQMWTLLHPETQEPLISEFQINEKGQLVIPVDFGPEKGGIRKGVIDPSSRNPALQAFLAENVWHEVKLYSFADSLKDVCSYLFDLTPEQCYGNNEQKNTPTKLVWKDMPGLPNVAGKKIYDYLKKKGFALSETWAPSDFMTAREVLQYVGTEIFRTMYYDVWVNATIKNILSEGSNLAVITDCRFPNEVEGVQKAGGKVVRLTRAPFAGQDEHFSETALDPENFDWTKFDSVIDNVNMTIEEQNNTLFDELTRLEILEPVRDEQHVS